MVYTIFFAERSPSVIIFTQLNSHDNNTIGRLIISIVHKVTICFGNLRTFL